MKLKEVMVDYVSNEILPQNYYKREKYCYDLLSLVLYIIFIRPLHFYNGNVMCTFILPTQSYKIGCTVLITLNYGTIMHP